MSRKSPLSRKESSNFLAFSFCFEEAFVTFLVLRVQIFWLGWKIKAKKVQQDVPHLPCPQVRFINVTLTSVDIYPMHGCPHYISIIMLKMNI